MWHQLIATDGRDYLSPKEVVSRLQAEFAYVETSEEDARRHVLEIVLQLQALGPARLRTVDDRYLSRLERLYESAISVHFGDELGPDAALLSTAVVPEEPLIFEYASRAEQQAGRPLVARCAAVLGYAVQEVVQ